MSWLLILTFTVQGQSSEMPVALLVDQNSCIIAGRGFEMLLEEANPGLDINWTCLPPVGEARA